MKSGILFLLLVISVAFNIYLYKGNSEAAEPYRMEGDTRESVQVTAEQRQFVMSEMRGFVEGMEEIYQGILENNPHRIAEAAEKSGSHVKSPKALREALPKEFLQMGKKTHMLFDAIADSALSDYDRAVAEKQLGQLMNNCVACHSVYRFDLP